MRILKLFLFSLSIVVASAKPELVVYTYDSFTAPWGAAAKVKAAFEKECNCTLRFVSTPSAMQSLRKIQMEGARSKADILLGLDTATMETARRTGLFAPHGLALPPLELPVAFKDDTFVPYDYGYFAFVYHAKTIAHPPRSLEEVAALPDNVKIVIQDPRSATPGMGLLLWVKAVYGEKAEAYWRKLAPHILSVTKSWSQAYALFLQGEAEMVFSYTTSPAYHRYNGETTDIKAAIFPQGHYGQIEVAAMLKRTRHPELARRFLRFLTSKTFARIVPTTNWSYPVVTPKEGLPEVFQTLPEPSRMLLLPPQKIEAHRKAWIREWLEALR